MRIPLNWLFLFTTTIYHIIITWIENRRYQPPGQMINLDGYQLHLYSKGEGNPTVVIEHSLGGIDGYFLIEEIAKITRVCIYDRAGYGWSQMSPKPRCSSEIVKELDTLLYRAGIEPPYLLVGNSFGSYNVRLYAHHFPEKVFGIVLTDGLHEEAMLKMPLRLKALTLFFSSGFAMSILGSILGLVRLLGTVGIFEVIKRELAQFPPETRRMVKRSFYRPQHWLTMWREIWNLEASGRQVIQADNLGDIPLVSIKARTFLNPTIGNLYIPIKAADKLLEKMHTELLKLSTNCRQLLASRSSHFVWIDEPEIILNAIQEVLQMQG
ncbi:MAG: alpha/beta hydrolase [Symploca sp. SIO3E6]|nr:alpha/beta hydrolase [Caldora sp. SIO3E6]